MNKFLLILFSTALLVSIGHKGFGQDNLDYYWYQNGGNWNMVSNWRVPSTINPGTLVPATQLPNVTNNVYFNASSFTLNASVVTVSGGPGVSVASCKNLIFSNITYPVTFAVNMPLSIAGSLTLHSNVSLGNNASGSITFTSTNANNTITSAGKAFNMPVIFNGVGGKWILQDNMVIGKGAQFVNGYVIALPSSIAADPSKYNELLPTTEATSTPSSPKFAFVANASVADASDASHVIGYVQKLGVNKNTLQMPNTFAFPTGNGTYYRPITIFDPSSSTGDFTGRYLSTNPAQPVPSVWKTLTINAPLNSVSNREFWYFSATGSANTKFSFVYNHPDAAIRNHYGVDQYTGITIGGLSVSGSGNATWSDMGAAPAAPATGTIASAGGNSSSMSWFTVGRRGHAPLPVELISFTASYKNQLVQLKWQTSFEKNTSHFVVERSTNGKTFELVLSKTAQGNSNSVIVYSVTDHYQLTGVCYYRLKMVDLDGTFSYSKLAVVNLEENLSYSVKAYPNPSKGNGISLANENGTKLELLAVNDNVGRPVSFSTNNTTVEGLTINFSQPLPAGLYLATVKVSDSSQVIKVKFVVQ